MLDIRNLRTNTDRVRHGLEARGVDMDMALDRILATDAERRDLLTQVEGLKNKRNVFSKDIGLRKKRGEDASEATEAMRALSKEIAALDERVREVERTLERSLLTIPNLPHASVPEGKDASANRHVRSSGERPEFAFSPKPHWELGQRLGLFDLERGARIAGAGFPLYVANGARLQRALIQFMLELHVNEHGYTEVWPPVLCNPAAMTGTGQLPKMAEDMYFLEQDGLYLIPTAEVPVTNLYREEIIAQPLPVYLTAYTPCFRREAGAAGRETRGLIRVHQFDKVELVKFVEPESSYEELESLLADAESVLQRLELPYRVLELCTGDLSFAAAKTYDIELWAPGHNDWLEVSSCSNFEDFQARRAQIRYRNREGKTAYVHTLNGSGVALARLVVALLENGQQADGSVLLPQAIRSHMGGLERLEPAP